MPDPSEVEISPDQSMTLPSNTAVLDAVLAKVEEVLTSQRETNTEIVKLRQRVNDVLTTEKHLSSEIVELRQRLNHLETPPTKADLVEMVRERDAKIAQLTQELADNRTVMIGRGVKSDLE
jgi:regulator of replication initiation timing